jgi:hypothetical protein
MLVRCVSTRGRAPLSNIVDLATRRPLAVGNPMRKRTRAANAIDAAVSLHLREVDPTKLLGYLGSVLPVDDLGFQVAFVLDRPGLLRQWADILLDEADRLERG